MKMSNGEKTKTILKVGGKFLSIGAGVAVLAAAIAMGVQIPKKNAMVEYRDNGLRKDRRIVIDFIYEQDVNTELYDPEAKYEEWSVEYKKHYKKVRNDYENFLGLQSRNIKEYSGSWCMENCNPSEDVVSAYNRILDYYESKNTFDSSVIILGAVCIGGTVVGGLGMTYGTNEMLNDLYDLHDDAKTRRKEKRAEKDASK